MIKNKAQKQKLLSPEAYIKEKARQLPIVECYIGTKWDYMGEKTVIVTRQHPQGHFTMGVYLVDIYCKGLLHSEYFFNMNHDDYEMMVKRIDMDEDLKKAAYADAHKLVYGAIWMKRRRRYRLLNLAETVNITCVPIQMRKLNFIYLL